MDYKYNCRGNYHFVDYRQVDCAEGNAQKCNEIDYPMRYMAFQEGLPGGQERLGRRSEKGKITSLPGVSQQRRPVKFGETGGQEF